MYAAGPSARYSDMKPVVEEREMPVWKARLQKSRRRSENSKTKGGKPLLRRLGGKEHRCWLHGEGNIPMKDYLMYLCYLSQLLARSILL